jgi:hypothetical protein
MGLGKRSVEMGLLTSPKDLQFHGRNVVIIAGIKGSNVPERGCLSIDGGRVVPAVGEAV